MQSRMMSGVLALAFLGLAGDAVACGGTFCDVPPPGQEPMPVDQSGENVLFVLGEGYVDAHVQIQYTGNPERFAWVVPMQRTPEVRVGSQALFSSVLESTVPEVSLTSRFESCRGDVTTSTSSGCGMPLASSDDSFAAGKGLDSPETEEAPADVVVSTEAVGSFEVTILETDLADDLIDWLATNEFLPDRSVSAPIFSEYVQAGFSFVAVKLRGGAGVGEIHPLVFRVPGTEPCIPLKLTRVAAVDDMPIRAFFLGEARVVPTTYRHVVPNIALLDYGRFGSNYRDVISRAVDAPGADGRAFVTEYSGSAAIVDTEGIWDPRWVPEAFEEATPHDVPELLSEQGLLDCTGPTCTSPSPLVFPLLAEHLPLPEGVSADAFYRCPSCYEANTPSGDFDARAFAEALRRSVFAPAEDALDALSSQPRLTRLFTTMSPDEMTDDPMFAEASDLDASGTLSLDATLVTECGGASRYELPDGSRVERGPDWPTTEDGLPPALEVTSFSDDGSAQSIVASFSEENAEALAEWNREVTAQRPSGTSGRVNGRSGSTCGGCAVQKSPARPEQLVLLLAGTGLLFRRRPRRNRKIDERSSMRRYAGKRSISAATPKP